VTRGEVQGYVPPIHWILVKNTLEETVPPYAVCVIAVPEDSEDGLPTVRKPSLRNLTAVWFNGPSPIPPGSEGQVTQTFPAYAAFSLQDGQTVLSAVEWGTKEDSWCMHPYYDYGSSPPIGSHYGWKRIGPAQGDAAPFVPAIRTRWALFANATTLSAPTAAADGTVADLLGIPNSESAQQRNLLYVYMATGLAMAVVGTSGYGLMLLPASETQMGAVTTGTQTLAGAKTLVGSLTVKTTAGATDGVAITGSSFTVTLSGVAWAGVPVPVPTGGGTTYLTWNGTAMAWAALTLVASAMSYTPTTPTDWNGGFTGTVAQALDRIATAIKALNGTGP